MKLQELRKLAGLPAISKVAEAYEESSDFDADANKVEKYLKDALAIIKSAAWQKHMKDTDSNFDTSCVNASQDLVKSINEALGSFKEFYDEIQKAA